MEKTLKWRMREDLQLRGLASKTQETYLQRVTQFARFCNKKPDKVGEEEVRAYLLYLINDRHVSYAKLTQTYCALKFIYEVTLKRPWEVNKDPLSQDTDEAAGGTGQRRSAEAPLRDDQPEAQGHAHDGLFGRSAHQ